MPLNHNILFFILFQRVGHNLQQFHAPFVYFNAAGIKKNLIHKNNFQLISLFNDFNFLGRNLILQALLDGLFGVIQ